MSTRSGKRLHVSVHENIALTDNDNVVKSERKTRSRRLKENCDEIIVSKSKKRRNYVSYATDEDQYDNTTKMQSDGKVVDKTSKLTLKEQDLNVAVATVDEIDSGKVLRQTRRTKKVSENVPEDIPVVEIENVKSKKKNKKNKKKKGVVTEIDINENEGFINIPKKSKRRKGKTSVTVSEIPHDVFTAENLNKSNGSIDSFHSAAGSTNNENVEIDIKKPNVSFGKSLRRASKRLKSDSHEDITGEAPTQNITYDKNSKKIKLSTQKVNLEVSNRSLRSDDESDTKRDKTFDKSNELPELLNTTFEKEPEIKRKSSIKNSTFDINNAMMNELNSTSKNINTSTLDKTFECENNGRRKSLRSTYEKTDTPLKTVEELNSTYEKTNTSNVINKTFEEDKRSRKSLRSTFDKTDTLQKNAKNSSMFEKNNTPFKLEDKNVRRKSLQSTFNKIDTSSTKSKELNTTLENAYTPSKLNLEEVKGRKMSLRLSMNANKCAEKEIPKITINNSQESFNGALDQSENSKLNLTFDKSKDSQQTINTTFEKSKDSIQVTINTTFEKSKDSKQSALNSTFDKEIELNSTFDKPENQSESDSKSLISSDSASNLTLDKSNEALRISITSDDSTTENIVNTTPVLIESSMDESKVLDRSDRSPKDIPQNSDETKLITSATPLKREGTFTKDGPEIVSMSPVSTPVKHHQPSPGSTPFPFSKSSQKEKSILNVTRSIEKPMTQSLLGEASQRQTRVMFCSPVNNPVVVMQQKRKIIKSNLKGSNKSFVFDESVSEPVRAAPRKRSYTQSDADDARAKRKRLAGDQLQSVARLSRPRTSSAVVKLSEPSTPSKKPATPLKTNLTASNAKSVAKLGRTKLPNFAALHQKQFAKMESLDECQVRKAKRARQLLTPTGLAIIEKSSPKGRAITATAESTKAMNEGPKKAETEVPQKTDPDVTKKTIAYVPKKIDMEALKKPDTPSKAPKDLTLDSLRPGYTRFGFKMNLDVNPFSIPPKTDTKPREIKPKSLVIRQPCQPSLAGATSGRREVAKQIVMRERSFTSLSDKRNEKRTMIKGVRTNRRFDLQMKMRNIS